jgi:predicted transcriptional regulator
MNDDIETLMTMTADIVAAHVSNNSVAVSDLPVLIANVHHALAALGGPTATPEVELNLAPAVSIRTSVKPDLVTCLDCSKKMKMLKRHLKTDHQMTVDQYRAKWNLPKSYPIVAPDYAAKRRTLALTIGLGRKLGAKAAKAK